MSDQSAVGFFGEREEIEHIFFTILDARQLAQQLDDIYFVSVTDTTDLRKGNGSAPVQDDLLALGYDTATLVMDEVEKLGVARLTKEKRLEFRKHFATLLSNSGRLPNARTGMFFNNFENVASPRVYRLQRGHVVHVPIQSHIGWWAKFGHKWRMLSRNCSGWIYLCLAIILVSLTHYDIKREKARLKEEKQSELRKWVRKVWRRVHHKISEPPDTSAVKATEKQPKKPTMSTV